MPDQSEPVKVAVLGGGPAALAAAFALTEQAPGGDPQQKFEVTVYQPGWRLGGKCASGRNADHGERIEEHGLHVWFGFYDNAFTVMRKAYEQLGRVKGQTPLATLQEAFAPCDEIVLYDKQGSRWEPLPFRAPRNDLEPGEPGPALPGFWQIVRWMAEWTLREYGASPGGLPPAPVPPAEAFARIAPLLAADTNGSAPVDGAAAGGPAPTGGVAGSLIDLLQALLALATEAAAKGTQQLPHADVPSSARLGDVLGHVPEELLVWLLEHVRAWLAGTFKSEISAQPRVRLLFTMFDTFASATIGVVEDGVLSGGWEQINGEDLCAWLSRHGAEQVTVGATPAERAPLLRSIYDVAFGYLEGDLSRADVAAGTAMNDFLRMQFGYRGAVMYKMQAGMGETVIAPFYEVLKARGVQFKFFHAVTGLELDAEKSNVAGVKIVRQVDFDVDGYEPLIKVHELPCWPNRPVLQGVPPGASFPEVDFEQVPNPLGREAETLVRGKDFDQVVLAIPVGALPPICEEIQAAHPPFAAMLANAATVCTQAFQLWLTATPTDLGWAFSPDSVAGCYVEPIDTWADMTHLLPLEGWSGSEVAGLAYFCGVLGVPEGISQQEADERVKAGAEAFVGQDVGALLPRTTKKSGEMNWQALADPSGAKGSKRFAAQYWRANVSGTERYVLTPAGSVASRLAAGDSGVANLVLAGDWTRNGIDGGCVEAAVTSGLQAAAVLTGAQPAVVGRPVTFLSNPAAGPVSMPPPLPTPVTQP